MELCPRRKMWRRKAIVPALLIAASISLIRAVSIVTLPRSYLLLQLTKKGTNGVLLYCSSPLWKNVAVLHHILSPCQANLFHCFTSRVLNFLLLELPNTQGAMVYLYMLKNILFLLTILSVLPISSSLTVVRSLWVSKSQSSSSFFKK